MCDLASRFQSCEEKEVGVVGEGNVLLAVAFEDAKLDYRRRVNRTTICRCCFVSVQMMRICNRIETYIWHLSHKLWPARAAE